MLLLNETICYKYIHWIIILTQYLSQVFSCVNGIVRAIIRIDHTHAIENINEYLKENFYAEYCEESFASKQDHLERLSVQRNPDPNDNTSMTLGVIQHLQNEELPVIAAPKPSQHQTHMEQITGPFSPLRIEVYGLSLNTMATIKIPRNSVNGVLLENEPNDLSEKHLVAVHVCQNDETKAISLRNTTLMPNIRLFGPLMAAIFAPRMLLKTNRAKTHYARMLTGLGCDSGGETISENTDLQFELDATLNRNDLDRVCTLYRPYKLNAESMD